MQDTDLIEKVAHLEEREKSNTKRIDAVENKVENIYDLTLSVREIATEMKAMREDQNKMNERLKIIEEKQGNLLITADHGNAEQMIDYKTGEPHTAHTTNPVPLILVSADKNLKLKQGGKLADLAPTMLDLMNLEKPEEMTGESLLDRE